METRLNKYLSESGVASRRGADRLVEEGRVTINGRAAVIGDKVRDGDTVAVDGKAVRPPEEDIILAYNKPRGVTCTEDRTDPSNIIDRIRYPVRIHTVGRLDKDSEGLILLTNNGDLANRIMRSKGEHEKEYIVTVDRDVTEEFIEAMSGNVPIIMMDGEVRITKKSRVRRIDDRSFGIVLRQGLNRQIRRMCDTFGYKVRKLVRIRVMNIELGDLEVGKYRSITAEEREELMRRLGLRWLCAGSSDPTSPPFWRSPAPNWAMITSPPRISNSA